MEFSYVGLIIGDDIYVDNNILLTDYNKHPSGATEFKRERKRNIDTNDKAIIDRLIRNTYKVLMTRGQKGTYIYCMNKDVANYMKNKVSELKAK